MFLNHSFSFLISVFVCICRQLWVGRLLLYSSVLYLLISLIVYCLYLPEQWLQRISMALPFFIYPVLWVLTLFYNIPHNPQYRRAIFNLVHPCMHSVFAFLLFSMNLISCKVSKEKSLCNLKLIIKNNFISLFLAFLFLSHHQGLVHQEVFGLPLFQTHWEKQ